MVQVWLDGRRWRTFLEILWVNVCVGDRPQTTTAYSTTTETLKFGNDANYWSFMCCQYCKFPAWMSHHQCLPQDTASIILHIFPFINRSNAALCDAWRWWKRCILRGLHSEAAVSTHYTIMQCINTLFELSPIPTYYDCRRWRHINWRRALCIKFKMLAALDSGLALALTALRFWS